MTDPGRSTFWHRFETEVVEPGNCTHCGACVGLAGGLLEFRDGAGAVPVPDPRPDSR